MDSNTENNITIAQTRQNKFKFPLILLIVLGIIFAAYTALTNYFTKKVISQDITEAAIAVNAPYQESPVISGINWDPASSVVRKATGSDNWPTTWASDNKIYTAYGDGTGFQSGPSKLSLGFSVISGDGYNFTGTDISSDGEQVGDGASGKKASGLLMVNNVLYMFIRNYKDGEGCQLAWSSDYASTWTWANGSGTTNNVVFTEFGYCTFINYGQNYNGAKDNNIYIVSHDNPSAYHAADRFILMRVNKDQVKNKSSYEFFKNMDSNNNPVWTSDITQRGAVFTNPGKARRSSISYNAGLNRYIWWQGIPHSGDERLDGGFGVYDAEFPWGPWTTAYYTDDWDMGPGESANFPTKWMSTDGKTMFLVFSGNDAFSVRKATVTLKTGSDPVDPVEPTDPDITPIGTWPGTNWVTTTPAEAGMSQTKLDQAKNFALTGGGSGFVTRGGKLVTSWGSTTGTYDLKSSTKGIGVTALGLAIKDGKMLLNEKAEKYHSSFGIPPTSNSTTGWLGSITLYHLATQTAGFDKDGGYTALLSAPGTKWFYSDGGPNWLAEAITLTYGKDLKVLMFERVFTPLGIPSTQLTWRTNIYRGTTINGIPNREFGSGIKASVDAMSRIGLMYLRKGDWKGQQIIPTSFIDQLRIQQPALQTVTNITVDGNAPKHYGLLWWNNADGAMVNVPKDTYFTWGLYDSFIIVIPSLDIVAARAGSCFNNNCGNSGSLYSRIAPFFEYIATSVTGDPDGGSGGPVINTPPIASATATPSSGVVPLTVSFNASGSSDPDGSIISYTWNYGDGINGSGVTSSHTYNSAGSYTAVVTVKDNSNATSTKSLTVNVSNPVILNNPPVAQNQNITTEFNMAVTLSLQYSDSDGPGPYTFTVVKNPSNGTLSGTGNSRTYTPNSGFSGTDTITWNVNDGNALSNTATYTVTVNTQPEQPDPNPVTGGPVIELNAYEDSYVKMNRIDNYGTAKTLVTSKIPDWRTYIKFNTQQVSGKVISKVSLVYKIAGSLNINADSSDNQIIKLVNNNWTEGTINGTNVPAAVSTNSITQPGASHGQTVTVNVTPIVPGTLDSYMSFVIEGTADDQQTLLSSEYSSTDGPKLLIEMADGSTIPTDPVTTGSSKIKSTEATQVDAKKPTTNYGSKKYMTVEGNTGRKAYIKFDLSSVANKNIKHATLNVNVTGGVIADSQDLQVIRAVNPSSWNENTLTFKTQPTSSTYITEKVGFAKNEVVKIDVTNAMPYSQNNMISFVINAASTTMNDQLVLYSDDSPYAPELEVFYDD